MLALLVLVLPAAAVVGWLVSRIASLRWRLVAVAVAIAVIVLGAVFGGLSYRVFANLMVSGIAVAVILVLTATGVGSVLGCARDADEPGAGRRHVRPRAAGGAADLSGVLQHLCLADGRRHQPHPAVAGTGLLFLIAAAFLVSSTLDRVRPILASPEPDPDDAAQLAGTPFEHMPDDPGTTPLSHPERANVVFVVAASQVGQVLTVAALTGASF